MSRGPSKMMSRYRPECRGSACRTPKRSVLGDLSVQGNILAPDAIGEMVLLAGENGCRVLLCPDARKEDVAKLPAQLTGRMESMEFFGTPKSLIEMVFKRSERP